MNHTPTPWTVNKYGAITTLDEHTIADCSMTATSPVSVEENDANATFIVLACNSFDRDQETIKKLTDALKQIHFDTGDPFADERSIDELHKQLLGVCNQAALALAETT